MPGANFSAGARLQRLFILAIARVTQSSTSASLVDKRALAGAFIQRTLLQTGLELLESYYPRMLFPVLFNYEILLFRSKV